MVLRNFLVLLGFAGATGFVVPSVYRCGRTASASSSLRMSFWDDGASPHACSYVSSLLCFAAIHRVAEVETGCNLDEESSTLPVVAFGLIDFTRIAPGRAL